MNDQIRHILSQITELEDDLYKLFQQQQVELNYRIEGTKVRFEESIKKAQGELRIGFFRFFSQSQFRNFITSPIIYSIILPVIILDLWVTIYQSMCFPLYRIPKVRRSRYIIVDRHNLTYLHSIEKINCIYCGYVGGVFTYVREIAARTEQYWCPIKHARKILDPHRRYAHFADFGRAENYAEVAKHLRSGLRDEKD